ncbi:hypothetical protein WJX81_005702 [Elliptochloris bilobata]|uniref:tRNA/rRNA methyltransferase SpoU type domain-containing protein n=1 Tax=Elliptochloris bilobata TaxID=381761 RepID=A0AAW1R2Q6_9CHLO
MHGGQATAELALTYAAAALIACERASGFGACRAEELAAAVCVPLLDADLLPRERKEEVAAELGSVLAKTAAWDAAALLLHKCAAALPTSGVGGAELHEAVAELAQAVDTPDLPVTPAQPAAHGYDDGVAAAARLRRLALRLLLVRILALLSRGAAARRIACRALAVDDAREDPATRKRAFAVLQSALPSHQAAEPPWSHFAILWNLLLQFPLHIVQQPFVQHMKQLRMRPDLDGGLNGNGADMPFTLAWEAVLWQVGFLHGNPQVARFVVLTFMACCLQGETSGSEFSAAFFLGDLLPALVRAMAVQGSAELEAAAKHCFAAYVSAAPKHRQREVVEGVASSLAAGDRMRRLSIACGLLQAAAALARPPHFSPAAAGPLLAEVPRAWLGPGQPLHDTVRGWLRGGAEGGHDAWLLQGLRQELEALHETAPGALPGAPVLAAEAAESGCGWWLSRRLARLCEAVADDLAAYCAAALQCFWAPPDAAPALGAAQELAMPREPKGAVRLPAALQAATTRAQLALDTAALALLCLLRSAAPDLRSAAAARAAGLLHGAATSFLHCFATTPILYWGRSRGGAALDRDAEAAELLRRALACVATACRQAERSGELDADLPLGVGVVGSLDALALACLPSQSDRASGMAALDTQRWHTLAAVVPAGGRVGQALGPEAHARAFAAAYSALDTVNQEAMVPLLACLRILVALTERHPDRLPATLTAAAALIATYLDTALAPELFQCTDAAVRAALHGEGGPLHWALEQLWGLAARSATAAALTALHLTALWLRHPQTALCYQGAWLRMLLFSCTENAVVGHQPGLEGYTTTDLAARVAAVAAAYELGRVAGCVPGGLPAAPADQAAAGMLGRALWAGISAQALGMAPARSGRYLVAGRQQRARVRAFQALAVLTCFAPDEDVEPTLAALWTCLEADAAPSVRQFEEAACLALLLRRPDLARGFLLPRMDPGRARVEGQSSLVLIGAQLLIHAPGDHKELLVPFFGAVLPWAMHHNHTLRCACQLAANELLQRFPALGEEPILRPLAAFLTSSADMMKLRRCMGPAMRSFDPAIACSPLGVFAVGARMVGRQGDGVPLEGAPESLVERVVSFLADSRSALRSARAQSASSAPCEAEDVAGEASQAYQQKPTAPDIVADLKGSSEGRCCQDLIVVASLIDKVPNLAGLARTCEVFGAAALVVADLRVLKEHQFRAVSMTAEQWVPMLEVPDEALLAWLLQRRGAGYQLVGLEQTAESTPLSAFRWPKRTVLVLGHEHTGIPISVLQVLDDTVVIPQLGAVRSLNVHVSGALESLSLRVADPAVANGLVHRYVVFLRQNARRGTASTLTRAEVRGGGRKPYAQKGTGNARQGSRRTPLRPGGGVTFGPKPTDWTIKMNKKERRLALATALQSAAGSIIVIDELQASLPEPKTKLLSSALQRWGVPSDSHALLIVNEMSEPVELASRNMAKLEVNSVTALNAYDILRADRIIVEREALKHIQEFYGGTVSDDAKVEAAKAPAEAAEAPVVAAEEATLEAA